MGKNAHQLQVEAIHCGTVIDHIPAHTGCKLLSLFRLTATKARITIGLNLPSSALGSKDLIKIESTFLSTDQINQLAIFAPQATVNRIENYSVVAKLTPMLPAYIERVLCCPNSHCISRYEPVTSHFKIKKLADHRALLTCRFCEKTFAHYAVLESVLT